VDVPGLVNGKAVCDGPDAVRLAARRAFRRGATQIKLMATGGVVSLTDELTDTQLTVEEMRAAVAEAEARNTYVTVHAHNCGGIRNGIAAGVRCVEHGTYLDEETTALMARHGVALVPTFTVVDVMPGHWREWGLPESVVPRLVDVDRAMANALALARAHGVEVGSGSDLLGGEQNRRGRELVIRARLEDSMRAIVSATSANARILRREDSIGSVGPGKVADLIAIEGDPLSDPELFDQPDRVVLVIKAGRVVKDSGRLLAL
jgi:imidazolonepropionase-like amidohydrolase